MASSGLSLSIQRVIKASPQRVFQAWTQAEHLREWWGPPGVICESVEIDLRIGGEYRIENRLPDGTRLWISGTFLIIDPPHRIVYTWSTDDRSPSQELVSVEFQACSAGTLLSLLHERIPNNALRENHARGWEGCLAGLRRWYQQECS